MTAARLVWHCRVVRTAVVLLLCAGSWPASALDGSSGIGRGAHATARHLQQAASAAGPADAPAVAPQAAAIELPSINNPATAPAPDAAASAAALAAADAPGDVDARAIEGSESADDFSTPTLSLLKPGELPAGYFAPYLNLTWRIVGPDTQPVTPDLRLAIQRAFASTISLNKFESQVTVTAAQAAPVTTVPTSPLSTGPTPGGRTTRVRAPPPGAKAATRRLLQGALLGSSLSGSGSSRAGSSARRLLQSPSSTQPPPPAARTEVRPERNATVRSAFHAVDAHVVVGFTPQSSFSRTGLVRASDGYQRRALISSLEIFGYEADFLPLSIDFPANYLTVGARLPQYDIVTGTSFHAHLTFTGAGAAPLSIEGQTGLQGLLVNVVPQLLAAHFTDIVESGTGDYTDLELQVNTAHRNGTFTPQEFVAVLLPKLVANLARLNPPLNVTMTAHYGVGAPNPTPAEAKVIAARDLTILPLSDIGITNATTIDGGADIGLSTGAIVGIVLGSLAAMLIAVVLLVVLGRRHGWLALPNLPGRDGGMGGFDAKLQGFAIAPSDIQICRRDDGTEWLLGQGAFGKVYKALRGGVQDVAVKQLHHTGDGQLEHFIEEVAILKGLNYDRNIVQFYGACIQEGTDPMLVVEYMEGGDLCTAIAADDFGELRWYSRGHQIALDIARGLYFLHSHDVMHLDLKTKNVLLTADMVGKIADVGLAQMVETGAEQDDMLAWTFAYAAPEVLMQDPRGLSADIYSFGVVLLEIVTGIMPVTRGRVPPPEVPEQCPQDIWDLIQRCMLTKPEDRPTAKECFDAITMSVQHSVVVGAIDGSSSAAATAAAADRFRASTVPHAVPRSWDGGTIGTPLSNGFVHNAAGVMSDGRVPALARSTSGHGKGAESRVQTSSLPADTDSGFQAQLVAWRMRERRSRQHHLPGHGSRMQLQADRRVRSQEVSRAPNPFADATAGVGPPGFDGGGFPNPFAVERARRDSGSAPAVEAAARQAAADRASSGSGEAAAAAAAAPLDTGGQQPDDAEQPLQLLPQHHQQPPQHQPPPQQDPQQQQQQQQEEVQSHVESPPQSSGCIFKMHPELSACSPLDQYFLSMGSVSQPSSDGLTIGKFGLTDAAALIDAAKVAEELAEIQEFVRAADSPRGHADTLELHLADLYSAFERQDSLGPQQDGSPAAPQLEAATSRASTSHAASDDASNAMSASGCQPSAGAAPDGQLLPDGSADNSSSSGNMYAVFDGSSQPSASVVGAPQMSGAQLRAGSTGSASGSGDPLPGARCVSLRGDDIYAAFGTMDDTELGSGPALLPSLAALPPPQPPQARPRSLARSQSGKEAPRPQPGRAPWTSLQLQLGRRQLRKQQPQQQALPANVHAPRKSMSAYSAAVKQPAVAPAFGGTHSNGNAAAYAVYQKYQQAHPLPLPAPPPLLPEPSLDPRAQPLGIMDATYDGEDAFAVYGHFSAGLAPQQTARAEDGSYAGEDAYSVYGRFSEGAQPAANGHEGGMYAGFAEAQHLNDGEDMYAGFADGLQA